MWSPCSVILAPKSNPAPGRGFELPLSGVRAVFHRPHPRKETDRGAVKSMRRFLVEAGVKP